MAAAGSVCLLVVLLFMTSAMTHNHSGETEIYRVSAGHLFLLRCPFVDSHTNVTWSREGRPQLGLPTGVEVRDGLLWFLPVQTSHNGTYTCEKRNGAGVLRMTFGVSVSSGKCPDPPETKSITWGVSEGLPCKQPEIFKLNNTRKIQWMKDCQPVEPVSVDEYGFMRLHQVSDKDAGKYTCLIDISLNGKNYTAARSIQLTINNDTVYTDLEVVSPQEEVVVVEVGMRWELKCLAYIGFSEDNDILMYWTIDREFTEDYKELNQSLKYIHHKHKVFRLCTLYFSEVRRRFLNIPFYCHVISPVKAISHMVMLQEADHSALHTSVALCLTASFVILVLAPASVFFKVDLVLVYRKLLRRVSKKQAPDGKLYDGYVIFSYPNTLSSTEVVNFALQILPEELENKHGYSLYIRGRDDCPGQAVHDVIAATVHLCRRLIIILPPQEPSADDGETEKELSLCDDQIWCYEQKLGLHSALTHKDLQVILVEIDGPVDYSRLPESLRYIKRKQGALKWRTASLGTHKLATLCSNRRFWKNLRYYMPSVPARRLQTIV
ncbi:interleukin-1 receptor-like 2 [Mastacembelus armatus]|uniref:Interleukin-1 receptor-like 2 n=1 Tax=Mastacembelus armatus TaxID=205130 RepID=A0A7N8YLM0_9TELE|nr:interleukin-1 receptor-like 2 [Mastacembelus armatus]XP_026152179.1 interleukin-1 receptor-like 2 [Mastacembelus armatus]